MTPRQRAKSYRSHLQHAAGCVFRGMPLCPIVDSARAVIAEYEEACALAGIKPRIPRSLRVPSGTNSLHINETVSNLYRAGEQ